MNGTHAETTGRVLRMALRGMISVGLLLLCVWYLDGEWGSLDGRVILATLQETSPLQWAGSLAAMTVAFLAVAGQERAVMAHFGFAVGHARGRNAAMATAALSQALGFGPLVGTIVRKRLLPEMSLAQSAQVSLGITAGFFCGICMLWLCLAASQAGFLAGVVALGMIAVLLRVALTYLPAKLRGHLPDGWTMLKLLFWLTLDLAALCVAAWIVLPVSLRLEAGLFDFAPLFLTALGAGLASGSPAGTGPFEIILLGSLAPDDPNAVTAGIIAFRLSGYAIPAALGAAFAAMAPHLRAAPGPDPQPAPKPTAASLTPVMPAPVTLANLRRAEVQLSLQGELALLRTAHGALWLHGRVPGCDVFVGDPVATADHAPCPATDLRAALARSARHGRLPCLYRVGPRLAAVARAQGMTTQLIAREGILDPMQFSTSGSAKSGLRRKLRHAEQAGVTVTQPDHLPLTEMAEVAQIWARTHGGERSFSMGRFNPVTLQHQAVFLARGPEGRLLAFISFHRCADEWVLDLIRCRSGIPDGTLYMTLVRALDRARQAGIRRLSLAAIPEPGWGMTGWRGQIVHRLTASTQGLCQFKQAFRPRWEKRYLVARSRGHLCLAGLGISLAIHPRPRPLDRPIPSGTAVAPETAITSPKLAA